MSRPFPIATADLAVQGEPRWWCMPDGFTIWGNVWKIEERRHKRAVVYRIVIHNWDGNMLTWAQLSHIRGWRPGDGSELVAPCEYVAGRRCLNS